MLYSTINRGDLEKLEELGSLQSPIEDLRLRDKLGKQNFHGDMKKYYEPLTGTIKETSRDIKKTMT